MRKTMRVLSVKVDCDRHLPISCANSPSCRGMVPHMQISDPHRAFCIVNESVNQCPTPRAPQPPDR